MNVSYKPSFFCKCKITSYISIWSWPQENSKYWKIFWGQIHWLVYATFVLALLHVSCICYKRIHLYLMCLITCMYGSLRGGTLRDPQLTGAFSLKKMKVILVLFLSSNWWLIIGAYSISESISSSLFPDIMHWGPCLNQADENTMSSNL